MQGFASVKDDKDCQSTLSALDTLLRTRCFPILTKLAKLKVSTTSTPASSHTRLSSTVERKLQTIDVKEFESILNEIDTPNDIDNKNNNTTKAKATDQVPVVSSTPAASNDDRLIMSQHAIGNAINNEIANYLPFTLEIPYVNEFDASEPEPATSHKQTSKEKSKDNESKEKKENKENKEQKKDENEENSEDEKDSDAVNTDDIDGMEGLDNATISAMISKMTLTMQRSQSNSGYYETGGDSGGGVIGKSSSLTSNTSGSGSGGLNKEEYYFKTQFLWIVEGIGHFMEYARLKKRSKVWFIEDKYKNFICNTNDYLYKNYNVFDVISSSKSIAIGGDGDNDNGKNGNNGNDDASGSSKKSSTKLKQKGKGKSKLTKQNGGPKTASSGSGNKFKAMLMDVMLYNYDFQLSLTSLGSISPKKFIDKFGKYRLAMLLWFIQIDSESKDNGDGSCNGRFNKEKIFDSMKNIPLFSMLNNNGNYDGLISGDWFEDLYNLKMAFMINGAYLDIFETCYKTGNEYLSIAKYVLFNNIIFENNSKLFQKEHLINNNAKCIADMQQV